VIFAQGRQRAAAQKPPLFLLSGQPTTQSRLQREIGAPQKKKIFSEPFCRVLAHNGVEAHFL
jgi:hypothetical protein